MLYAKFQLLLQLHLNKLRCKIYQRKNLSYNNIIYAQFPFILLHFIVLSRNKNIG